MSKTELYDVETVIKNIADQLRRGNLKNETAVRQCAVTPVLRALKWNTDDAGEVSPEHSTGRGRVDYALFARPARMPRAFIETKAVGKIVPESEDQLFHYAFYEGAPILILTDGKEWNFYLTAAEGKQGERRFYKINIEENTPKNVAVKFCDYLSRSAVVSGNAKKLAEKILKSKERINVIQKTMPEAWQQLLKEDDLLRVLLTETVEKICGYEPGIEFVEQFLRSQANEVSIPTPARVVGERNSRKTAARKSSSGNSRIVETHKKLKGFTYGGKRYMANSAIGVLMETVKLFAVLGKSKDFLERLETRMTKPKTKMISKDRESLFARADHLADRSKEITINSETWWLNSYYSKARIIQHLEKCCEVAGVKYGKDFKIIEE